MGEGNVYPDGRDSLEDIFSARGLPRRNWPMPQPLERRDAFMMPVAIWALARLPQSETDIRPRSPDSFEEEWDRMEAELSDWDEDEPAAEGGDSAPSHLETAPAPVPLPHGYRSTRVLIPFSCFHYTNDVDLNGPAEHQLSASARERRMAEDAEFERALNAGLFAPPRHWTDEERMIQTPVLVDSRRCLDLQPEEMEIICRSRGECSTGSGSEVGESSARRRLLEGPGLSTWAWTVGGPSMPGGNDNVNAQSPNLKLKSVIEDPEDLSTGSTNIYANFAAGVGHLSSLAPETLEDELNRLTLQLGSSDAVAVDGAPGDALPSSTKKTKKRQLLGGKEGREGKIMAVSSSSKDRVRRALATAVFHAEALVRETRRVASSLDIQARSFRVNRVRRASRHHNNTRRRRATPAAEGGASAFPSSPGSRVGMDLSRLPVLDQLYNTLVQHPPSPQGFARGSLTTARGAAHLESTGLLPDLSQLTLVEEADSAVPADSEMTGHHPGVSGPADGRNTSASAGSP